MVMMELFERTPKTCLAPFVAEADYPPIGGYIDGRFCATTAAFNNISCCLPCPLQNYVYSDSFPRMVDAAFWVSLPSFILQIFLIFTFIVLPEKDGHGHYLNWGLVVGVALLELCLIVPEAAHPNYCFDAITPNDMGTSMACAWSGALLLAGAMAAIMWILLRSLFTHLRVVWSIELPRWFPIISHIIGWGIPALFLSISLPITGVSFQVGPLCLPKKRLTFVTWFGWYLAFSCVAAVIQISTTIFCLIVYLASFRGSNKADNTTSALSTADSHTRISKPKVSGMYNARPAWQQVKKVLLLQWRSILMSLLVVVEAIYFGVIYTMLSNTAQQQLSDASNSPSLLAWGTCLVSNKGDKDACLDLAAGLGLQESAAVASFIMLSIIGIFTFLLMVRKSMFIGWYQVLRDPKRYLYKIGRRKSSVEEEFVLVSSQNQPIKDAEHGEPHGIARSEHREFATKQADAATADQQQSRRESVMPEPGDVSRRHETTNFFDKHDHDDDDEEEEE